MEMKKQHLFVMVKDNGKGFDTTQKKENAFGLIGMKERVELLEGTMNIRSQIGVGTTIFIQIPLNM